MIGYYFVFQQLIVMLIPAFFQIMVMVVEHLRPYYLQLLMYLRYENDVIIRQIEYEVLFVSCSEMIFFFSW